MVIENIFLGGISRQEYGRHSKDVVREFLLTKSNSHVIGKRSVKKIETRRKWLKWWGGK